MIQDIQKASMWKRISAALLDAVIFVILMEALILLFSAMLGSIPTWSGWTLSKRST